MVVPKPDGATINRLFRIEKEFVSSLLSICGIAPPSGSEQPEDQDEEDDLVYVGDKKSLQNDKKLQRANNFQELQEKLKTLKGNKDFSVKNKLKKKSLARRIKKKNRKEARRNKNKILKPEKKDIPKNDVKSEKVENVKNSNPKPVFNSQGKMVFSKFDFSESGIPEKKKKGEQNPRRILENLKKQKDTLKDLSKTGEQDKAVHIMEKTVWKNALAKAEGQKIKDDPLLLKKTVKKMEQKKKKSTKKWEQRIQTVEKAKQDKQKRRDTNILKRKQEKKKKVISKAVKKGRMLPT